MNQLSLLNYNHNTKDISLINEFKEYPFELDDFQKHSIEKIRMNENILVTAATGSGKTLCCDYAIKKSVRNNKKCIYTSPIKALSNQKFYEFKKKFKGFCSIGIFTGDIKYNPDADVLIMTTEILRNLLYKKDYEKYNIEYNLDLSIDLDQVDCIIFDELHYINDVDRGKVWEETLVLLPRKHNLVLLSATINNASDFAMWLQSIKQKYCHLIPKKERVIPLNHFIYYHCKYPRKLDKEESKLIMKKSNKLLPLLDHKKVFDDNNYHTIQKIVRLNKKCGNTFYSRTSIIHNCIGLLQHKKLLPALFFVFSRKSCEELAYSIDKYLNSIEEQSKVLKIVKNYIHKLNNKDIYLKTNEYLNLLKLLQKGVAYHHSGMRIVYKEIIELLCNEGLIKVLFATETFAVGINAPIKTVIFTDIKKYSNDGIRHINTSEYLQMAGRAGRRGKDKVGTVILLGNLIELPIIQQMKNIMNGFTENIMSKFILNYQFILKVILSDSVSFENFLNNTLSTRQNQSSKRHLEYLLKNQENIINNLKQTKYPTTDHDKYYELLSKDDLTKGEKKFLKKLIQMILKH
jgi:superfamily II RNA helicase